MSDEELTIAERAFLQDLSLDRRASDLTEDDVARAVRGIEKCAYPVVYTAFDGDHFALTSAMRRYCLRRQVVPANPESILGYKDTVDARHTKEGVLLDDLAVLKNCDELWVFTDLPKSEEMVRGLAEGVLVELVYFMMTRDNPVIRVVGIRDILKGRNPKPIEVSFELTALVGLLAPKDWHQVHGFVQAAEASPGGLSPITAVLIDPLDSKYLHWIRPYYLSRGNVALVPGLAIEIADVERSPGDLRCLLVSWATLVSRLASDLHSVRPMEPSRPVSNTVAILCGLWEKGHGSSDVIGIKTWHDFGVPKALQGKKWPVTSLEHYERS